MVLDLGSNRQFRGWARALLVAAVAATMACGGCEECGEQPAPDMSAPPPTPDVSVEDEPEDTSLVVATELAESEGEKIAVRAGDTARAVAGEIEALTTDKNKPRPPRPRLKDEPETGKLERAQLNKVFNLHADAMKSCYERSLKRSPGLMGKVRLEVLIRANGEVRSANARGISLRDDAVTSCMERQAKTMKFPEPEGGALRVNKTYSFTPDF